jgi:hypothetical protein
LRRAAGCFTDAGKFAHEKDHARDPGGIGVELKVPDRIADELSLLMMKGNNVV